MHQSSSSIAELAAALAKAQVELVNPEKSLVGSIHPIGTPGTERLFRYAPLSAGLDIVRKTLGRCELAVLQTTSLDQTSGTVNLTTVLAHTSGQWVSSTWPVCAISETETPHRMGAALTYARRYALFTLVGIAGEDDLDAPDLITPTSPPSGPEKPKQDSGGRANGIRPHPRGPARRRHDAKPNSTTSSLGLEDSAQLRQVLLTELTHLASADEAASWARQRISAKNELSTSDAEQIETAFRTKLATFGDGFQESATPPNPPKPPTKQRPAQPINKSLLAVPELRRIRDRDHVRSVAKRPCLVCGRQPSDAHHLRFAQARALGRKASDEFTVPLCRGHHREAHRSGNEAAWWEKIGIDPMMSARVLWLASHPLPRSTKGKNSNLEEGPGRSPANDGGVL